MKDTHSNNSKLDNAPTKRANFTPTRIYHCDHYQVKPSVLHSSSMYDHLMISEQKTENTNGYIHSGGSEIQWVENSLQCVSCCECIIYLLVPCLHTPQWGSYSVGCHLTISAGRVVHAAPTLTGFLSAGSGWWAKEVEEKWRRRKWRRCLV